MKEQLRITLVTDPNSWLRPHLVELSELLIQMGHNVSIVYSAEDIYCGDIAFFLSFQEIVSSKFLRLNNNNIVVHQSGLPKGKGMSPLAWQILEGKNEIPITLFEAVEELDAGQIYLQRDMKFKGTELLAELQEMQKKSMFGMCVEFVSKYPSILGYARDQEGESTYYSRRIPKDSELDVKKTIEEQFELLRIVDNKKYPAFFTHRGETYVLEIEKYHS